MSRKHAWRAAAAASDPRAREQLRAGLAQAGRLQAQGQVEQAERVCRELEKQFPGHPAVLARRGLLAFSRGQHGPAMQLLRKASGAAPDNAVYHYNLGEVCRAAGHPERAVECFRRAVALDADMADAHFNLGNALHELGRIDEALAAYRRAESLAPNDAEVANNLGNALRDTGDVESAVEAYRRALDLDPAHPDPHANLADLLQRGGHAREAARHAEQALSARPRWPALNVVLARARQALGEEIPALESWIAAYQGDPLSTAAHLGLVDLARRLGAMERALAVHREAAAEHPRSAQVQCNLGDALQLARQPEAALEAFDAALGLDARLALAHAGRGRALADLHRTGDALAAFDRALRENPALAQAHVDAARALQAAGRFDEARERATRALELQPRNAMAFYLLATDGEFRPDSAFVERLEALAADDTLSPTDAALARFALARVVERDGDPERIFACYRAANGARLREQPCDIEGHLRYHDRIRGIFTPEFFARFAGAGGNDSELPVFIVGMPRCGSTLTERILGGHGAIVDAGELGAVRDLVPVLRELSGGLEPFPELMTTLDPHVLPELAGRYLDCLPPHDGALRVTDKMLGNYARLGLIALLFPRARIIHCVRNPLDTCLSCYFQNFSDGLYQFTYDLEHLGRAYRAYWELMQHWWQVLPNALLEVRYEDVVADIEGQSRRLVEFCGLDWDPACTAFHEREGSVSTASVWQVRQPLYRSSVGRWKRYRDHLAPLVEALGDLAEEG